MTTTFEAAMADRLREEREEAVRHLARLRGDLTDVQAARSDAGDDDEHDPEGPTMSQEWSQLAGLASGAERDLAAIDRALARIEAGTYGVCTRCGGPIGEARLEARPAAELCIECARAAG
jgi:RNA polymerase-binding protein DksA